MAKYIHELSQNQPLRIRDLKTGIAGPYVFVALVNSKFFFYKDERVSVHEPALVLDEDQTSHEIKFEGGKNTLELAIFRTCAENRLPREIAGYILRE